ncbi:hypothetical protein K491DRAFT_717765 [Lophiostoma macrostomum CBS 122681]|uniref:Uncharacterized protein n=1 Tax=Lophiostoma macrostomum CBS 122681 TaxID=1314788 RepID=A0A6A6T4Q8_9PLEO|nr:hypothetical protein K491DRAFT_717765 [Lophiostoma macrostomum CBS 122681]
MNLFKFIPQPPSISLFSHFTALALILLHTTGPRIRLTPLTLTISAGTSWGFLYGWRHLYLWAAKRHLRFLLEEHRKHSEVWDKRAEEVKRGLEELGREIEDLGKTAEGLVRTIEEDGVLCDECKKDATRAVRERRFDDVQDYCLDRGQVGERRGVGPAGGETGGERANNEAVVKT